MLKFRPTNNKFYEFFDRSTDVVLQAAEHFRKGLSDFQDGHRLAEDIKGFEHQGDEITHETMEMLHKSFITPLERGDIRRLVMAIDDILDALDDAARRIALYELNPILPNVQRLAEVLVRGAEAVQKAVHELPHLKRRKGILDHCIEVHHCEDEGDRIYHLALAGLFKSGMDPLMVVKWKDIIEDMEHAIDSCQDVAVVVAGIVLEHS
jgi:uncharacterized protein Yka (UPF0111/DUF47 family)